MEAFVAVLRGVVKTTLFVLVILSYLAWSFVCHVVYRDPKKRLRRFSLNVQFYCRVVLKILNLKLNVVNKPVDNQKFLLVSNHMGFIDILMMSSAMPLIFVTSKEMRETPFLGLLCDMGGCIYVERRSRSKIIEEMQSIVSTLKDGFRVVLYPEATSTNAEAVLPFKKTLMMAAPHAGVPIQPAVINFRKVNGEDFSLKWRDHLCWYGDIPFVTSMWKATTLRSIEAEIEFLEQIHATPDDDRGVIAEKAYMLVSSKFTPVKGSIPEVQAPVEMQADPT